MPKLNVKTPGTDQISAKLIKYGCTGIHKPFRKVILCIWDQEQVS